jgi:N6-adenosine-specific RNA methylase IME4
MRARVVVADPPWRFSDKLPGPKRGAAAHYPTLRVSDIADRVGFDFPELEADAVLFLWRVAAMQEEALTVMRAWGFSPKTELVWVKTTTNGNRHFGMGRILRAEHEVCLIGTRGKPKPLNNSTRSVLVAPRGRHSHKPPEFFRLVESLYEGPYVELFARRRRLGWTCYGDELESGVDLAE